MFNKQGYKKYSDSPYMKTSYQKDMVMSAFDTPFRKKFMIVGLAFFAVIPFTLPPFFVHVGNLIAIACIGAMALNLVTGTAGLLSLGHSGFMAAGAFTVGILHARFGMPIWVTIPMTVLVGAAIGLLAGLPSLRLKGVYLGIGTMAMYYIIYYVASEYQFNAGYGEGIRVGPPSIGVLVLNNEKTWHFFLWFFVWLTGVFITNLLRSRPGRAWIAIRNRDIAARVIGVNIGQYKVLAFVVSTAITSMSGGLYAYYTNLAAIDEYTFYITVSYLAMIIVGGIGSVLGAIMGAFLITLVPYLLMFLFGLFKVSFLKPTYFYAIQSCIFGSLIIVFFLVEPLGLIEIWRRVRTRFELWPFRYRPLKIATTR